MKTDQDQLSAYRSQFEGTEVKTWSETKVEGHKQTAVSGNSGHVLPQHQFLHAASVKRETENFSPSTLLPCLLRQLSSFAAQSLQSLFFPTNGFIDQSMDAETIFTLYWRAHM